MKDETYRQGASVLLLRPINLSSLQACYQILLLHKHRRRDAWQLPQGGVEAGETIEGAALRELEEETGIRDVQVIGKSKNVYQYNFPPSYRRFRPDHVCGQCINFVLALCAKDTHVQVDGKEIESFAWIDPSEISQYIVRKEYLNVVEKIVREAQNFLKM